MRCENRTQLFSCESLSLVEMGIYTALRLILTLAAMFAPFTACQTLWQGLATRASSKAVVDVIDRLLVVLMVLTQRRPQ